MEKYVKSVIWFIVFCCFSSTAFADSPALFSNPQEVQVNAKGERTRSVNAFMPGGSSSGSGAGYAFGDNATSEDSSSITLNLFDDVQYVAEMDRIMRRSEVRYTWFGHVQGEENGSVILVINNGRITGQVEVGGTTYSIRATRDGSHEIIELGPQDFIIDIDDGDDGAETESTNHDHGTHGFTAQAFEAAASADGETQIDIMVIYTAEAAAGASGDIQDEIQLAIDVTNQTFINSQVNAQLNLVHAYQTDFTEDEDTCDELRGYLDFMQQKNDGVMDDLHSLRNEYNADVISFWVEDGCGWGGRARIMTTVSGDFEDRAIHVLKRSCASSYYCFTHELGHNMSARHDRFADNRDGSPFDFNHGYVDIDNTFRTIMAYNSACTDADTSCSRIPYWSNPDVYYTTDDDVTVTTGIADGEEASNNALTLNTTKDVIAAFRDNGTCNSSIMTLTVDAPVQDAEFNINDPVLISAHVTTCDYSDSGATLTVSSDADGVEDFVLYDDGNHGDGEANDGTYATTWNADVGGSMYLTITAAKDGSTSRYVSRRIIVQDGSDFPSDGNVPTDWDNGTYPWVIDTDTKYDGWHSLRSGDVSDNQDSVIEYTASYETTYIWGIPYAPSVTFHYKVSSEARYDFLRFYIDGELQDEWAGEVDWTEAEYSLEDGEHTLRWVFHKDQSVSNGSDAGWIDMVDIDGVITNFPPEVAITSPADNSGFTLGESVICTATANDTEDGDVSENIRWFIDSEGLVGNGPSITFDNLTAGEHIISMNATDSGNRTSQSEITINVIDPAENNTPVVTISSPSEGSSYEVGESGTLTATADDTEDGDLSADISWSSSIVGDLGTGASLNVNSLTVGNHSITATVNDSMGISGIAKVSVTITAAPVLGGIASQSTATASEQYSSSFAAAEMIDGDTSEFWASRYNPGDEWVQLTWSEEHTIRELTINWHSSYYAQNFDVQARIDGSWVDQTGTLSGNSSESSVSLNVTTDAIRINLSNRKGNFYGIRELDVQAETNTPPTVSISAPFGGTTITVGESLTFTATANDVEDGELSSGISWSSSIDGALGTGNSVDATLTVGTHTITASVTDNSGSPGSATVSVTVEALPNVEPTVAITSPESGITITEGDSLQFTGTAADDEDGDLSSNIVWTSNIDGSLGTGSSITVNLDDGEHTITATVTDSANDSVSISINVSVTALPNSDPTVSINSPANGTTITEGESLTFTGSADDAEDGDISGSIVWTSDIDGNLGTGSSISSSLVEGTHTITATITDSEDAVDTASITVIVEPSPNSAPTIGINSPANNAEFTEGASVTFSGSASDDEDGNISANIVWSSSRDGNIGTGSSVNTSSLSFGTHTITATITDSAGADDTASIVVVVNEQSNVNIAPQATANASSSYSNSYAASLAIDEDTGTFWASDSVSYGGTAWLHLAWDNLQSIHEVTINWHSSYYARDFKVYAMVNGSWVDQTGTLSGSSSGNTVTLDVNTTSIYVSMTRNSGNFYGVRELIVK